MKYVVTTSYNADAETIELAKSLANKFEVKYVRRNHISKYLKSGRIDFYYVIDKNGMLKIQWKDGEFFFHQGISKIRMENIKHGKKDYIIESVKPESTDIIYDATFGLGSDAILMAHFAKKVIGTEGSEHIYRVVKWGLKRYVSDEGWINDAIKKIELINANYKDFIRKQEDESFDIVYCDPMFENPIYESNTLNPLRSFAIYEPLNVDDLLHMLRIARKRVVIKTLVKDKLYIQIKKYFSKEFIAKKSGVVYGIINKSEVQI